MDLAQRIAQVIAPTLEDLGYDLVRVQLQGSQRQTLQVMAERQDQAAMTVDDCAQISRSISAVLDVADPISGAYTLEVSSPGLDRPLTRLGDFARFVGYQAKVEMSDAIDGRKRFNGTLGGVQDADILIEVEGDHFRLPFAGIHKAKLVLTEALLRQAAAGQAHH